MTTFGTRVTKALGPVTTQAQVSGFQTEADILNKGFAPFRVDSVTAVTSNSTLTNANAGVVTLSGSATALTGTMPKASDVPGAMFLFRNLNASVAHQLTSSQETAGSTVFTDGFTKGAKLAMASGVDKSVCLMSDGANFLVLGGASGAFATTGGAGSLYTIS
jgi:hypothetical protein